MPMPAAGSTHAFRRHSVVGHSLAPVASSLQWSQVHTPKHLALILSPHAACASDCEPAVFLTAGFRIDRHDPGQSPRPARLPAVRSRGGSTLAADFATFLDRGGI